MRAWHRCLSCGVSIQSCASILRHTNTACCQACDHPEEDD